MKQNPPCVRCLVAPIEPKVYFADTELCSTCDHEFYAWRAHAVHTGVLAKAVDENHKGLVEYWKTKVLGVRT